MSDTIYRLVYGAYRHFQQYFSYIVQFIIDMYVFIFW
jgi:hypothetical protein